MSSTIDQNSLISLLDHSLVRFYNQYLFPTTDMPIQDYVMRINLPYEDYLADIPENRRFHKKARTKTKINWYRCALRDIENRKIGSVAMMVYDEYVTELHKGNSTTGGVDFTDHIYNDLSYNIDYFSAWTSFYDIYTDKLNEWRNNGDLLLTDFPLIHLSTLRSKEMAFSKELILNVIDLLEKGIGLLAATTGLKKGVILQPFEFLFAPYVSVNSPGTQLLNKEKNSDSGSLILYDDYKVPKTGNYGNLVIRSLIDTSDITEQDINLRSLSAFDVSVFMYIINYVCENDYTTFLSTRTFQNYLSHIVKAVYPNEKKPSSRCYSQVRHSLSKLASLHIKGIRNGEVVLSIDFFDKYHIYEEEKSGQQVVTLTVGTYMYDRIATKKIHHVYEHEVDKISDRSSQFVYYVFESERQKAYASNRINSEQLYEYSFFLHTMRFSSRNNVKKNLDLIDSIFQSYVEKGILFLSYRRLPKGFVVKFKPFLKDDIAKLKLIEPSLLPVV